MIRERRIDFYSEVEVMASERLHAGFITDEEFYSVCDILDAFLSEEWSIEETVEELACYLPVTLLQYC